MKKHPRKVSTFHGDPCDEGVGAYAPDYSDAYGTRSKLLRSAHRTNRVPGSLSKRATK
jgi:hypothetical protein